MAKRKARKDPEEDDFDQDFDEKPIKKSIKKTKKAANSKVTKSKTLTKKVSTSSEKPEQKRDARYRKVTNQKVRDRIKRAISQKMFVVSKQALNDHTWQFSVIGSTGNLYKVTLGHRPCCDCPDAAKGNVPCKHSLFVFLKVLKFPQDDPMIWQVAYTTEELKSMFEKVSSLSLDTLDTVAPENVRQLLTVGNDGEKDEQGRRQIEGDCGICFDEMKPDQDLQWCKSGCGNNVHSQCFQMWSNNLSRNGTLVTCVYCRAPWVNANVASDGGNLGKEGYVNFAQDLGLSENRDVSTYYQGAVAGRGMKHYDSQGKVFYLRKGVGAVDEEGNRIQGRGWGRRGNFRQYEDDFDEEPEEY